MNNSELSQAMQVTQLMLTAWDKAIVIPEFYMDPIFRILRNKLTYSERLMQLNNVVPDGLIGYCENCSEGNPGMAQMILKRVLGANKNKLRECIRTGKFIPVEFHEAAKVSTSSGKIHPFMSIPEVYQYYSKIWEGQKISREVCGTDNGVDTVGFWEELL